MKNKYNFSHGSNVLPYLNIFLYISYKNMKKNNLVVTSYLIFMKFLALKSEINMVSYSYNFYNIISTLLKI